MPQSPVIDEFIPLDEDQAAAERCGRFCVVMDEPEEEEEDLINDYGSAAPYRAMSQGLLLSCLTIAAGQFLRLYHAL